ncbi:hypothetical protein P8452_62102 [Trifolium repens]|jgi:hypothetical protein|nr:hypothetical protein P8452_62102 [Trifolium repens]
MFPYSGVWWLADFVMAEGGGLRRGSLTAGLVVLTVVLAGGGGGCVLPDLGIKCGTVVLCRGCFRRRFGVGSVLLQICLFIFGGGAELWW